jgi:hypothetical protein
MRLPSAFKTEWRPAGCFLRTEALGMNVASANQFRHLASAAARKTLFEVGMSPAKSSFGESSL